MARLLAVLVLGGALLYGVVALTCPWALHMGGRWTPLLYWSGSGKLATTATAILSIFICIPQVIFLNFTWTGCVQHRWGKGSSLAVYVASGNAISHLQRYRLRRLAQH
jgi:hypothetical protein